MSKTDNSDWESRWREERDRRTKAEQRIRYLDRTIQSLNEEKRTTAVHVARLQREHTKLVHEHQVLKERYQWLLAKFKKEQE